CRPSLGLEHLKSLSVSPPPPLHFQPTPLLDHRHPDPNTCPPASSHVSTREKRRRANTVPPSSSAAPFLPLWRVRRRVEATGVPRPPPHPLPPPRPPP